MTQPEAKPAATAEQYLDRIRYTGDIDPTLESLEALQRAHMTAVAFENIDVFRRVGVSTDIDTTLTKIVQNGRGGWCFENNGAFAWLLDQLGFDVRRLGAAVLLGGPNQLIDHLTLEVTLDRPYLVDVGFGASFVRPLALNVAGAQDGGAGCFELLPSPQGTTLARDDDGVPVPQYRFKRVTHALADFEPASRRLQTDPSGHWLQGPFATRLIDGGPDRVTLLKDRIKFERGGQTEVVDVAASDWSETLATWFEMTVPMS